MSNNNYPFQAQIIGQECVPPAANKGDFDFLYEVAIDIQDSQVVRLVVPKRIPESTVRTAWWRATKAAGKKNCHARKCKNGDDSYSMYLSVGEFIRRDLRIG